MTVYGIRCLGGSGMGGRGAACRKALSETDQPETLSTQRDPPIFVNMMVY